MTTAVFPGPRENRECRADMPSNVMAATFKTFYYMFMGVNDIIKMCIVLSDRGH